MRNLWADWSTRTDPPHEVKQYFWKLQVDGLRLCRRTARLCMRLWWRWLMVAFARGWHEPARRALASPSWCLHTSSIVGIGRRTRGRLQRWRVPVSLESRTFERRAICRKTVCRGSGRRLPFCRGHRRRKGLSATQIFGSGHGSFCSI